jgi:hypothetical protein
VTSLIGELRVARRWVALLPGVLLSLCPGFAICCGSSTNERVEHEIQEIHRITLPADAKDHVSDPIERSSWAVEARWRFETEMSWPEYATWMESRLPEGFELRAKDERSARFRRQLPGDVHQLEVLASGEPPMLLVVIDFRATAF